MTDTFAYVTFTYTICYIKAIPVHYVTNKQIHVTEKFALSEEINYLCTRKKKKSQRIWKHFRLGSTKQENRMGILDCLKK